VLPRWSIPFTDVKIIISVTHSQKRSRHAQTESNEDIQVHAGWYNTAVERSLQVRINFLTPGIKKRRTAPMFPEHYRSFRVGTSSCLPYGSYSLTVWSCHLTSEFTEMITRHLSPMTSWVRAASQTAWSAVDMRCLSYYGLGGYSTEKLVQKNYFSVQTFCI
jgi:hypothetical protein